MKFKCIIIGIGSAILMGCASFYDIDANNIPKYQKPTHVDTTYDISGRFSVNRRDRHDYGNFTWNKTSDYEELNLNTPMGQTIAQVRVERGIPTLTTRDHVYVGDDVEDMLYDHLGIDLPIDYLHYWIAGVPFPGSPVTKELADGFVQDGFNVEYLSWQDPNHPHILKCSSNDFVIKLLITWK